VSLRPSSLLYVVILALLIGLLAPTAAVLIPEIRRTRDVAMQELRRELERSTEVMSLSLAEPVWQVSGDLAEPMVRAQLDDPRFVSVRVTEPSSTQDFLYVEGPQRAGDPELMLSASRPILRDGREIAKVQVTMSAAPLLAARMAELQANLWRSLLTLTISVLLILGVMRKFVLKPMAHLTESAEALASGRLDSPLSIRGSDEIARVGLAMERMRQALLSAFEALREHAATLEDQVAQRTAELTSTNAELSLALANLRTAQRELVESEKLASLGRLVAGVAHELNTPLGNSLTVVSALEDRYKQLEAMLTNNQPMRRSQLEELVRDTLRGQDILQRNVQKAADLVRDFKSVAINRESDLRRSFDLAQVVKDVLVMVEPGFKRTPYKIETHLAEGLTMDGYPGRLGQVVSNLVMNALVHGLDGLEQGTVRVSCSRLSATQVELQVEDNGRGMGEDVRRRVFDPFFTTKLGQGGSGLGMHIVHNIICNMLGGQIEVLSSPGQGARMVMRLPSTAPQAQPDPGDEYASSVSDLPPQTPKA